MGLQKHGASVSSAVLAMAAAILLSVAATVPASRVPRASSVNPFCDTADDKALCTRMVGNAKTWTEAMTNALKATRQKVKAGKKTADHVGKLLPSSMKPMEKKGIVETCHESYQSIMDNINSSMEDVKDDPTGALRSDLSAMGFTVCMDTLDESDIKLPEEKKFDDTVNKLTGVLLALAEKKPKNVTN